MDNFICQNCRKEIKADGLIGTKNRIAGDDDPEAILKIEDSKDLRTALFGKPK